MRRTMFLIFFLTCALFCRPLHAAAFQQETITAEILRLRKEVPSLAAFEDVRGVAWHNSYHYALQSDGTMKKTHLSLLMLREEDGTPPPVSHLIPFPAEEGALVTVDEAAWYHPSSGEREGNIPYEPYDEAGIEGIRLQFPAEARGRVIAIATTTISPRRLSLDDLLVLAADIPIWEQRITVEIPEGMNLYWEGVGIREPQRTKSAGLERIEWSVLNQPAWQTTGIVDERRPMLLFSLGHGLISDLRTFRSAETAFKAPPLPQHLAASRGDLLKLGERIMAHMAERRLVIAGFEPPQIRRSGHIPPDGPWTGWEQVLIAAKWFESLGWETKILWTQHFPVGPQGPVSRALWREPILKIASDKDTEIYYKSGQLADFGKLPPSLYGAVVYRTDGTDIERAVLPIGSASDHTLGQMWRLSLDENGIATGTLDLTVTGAWVDLMSLGRSPSLQGLPAALQRQMTFTIPGLVLEPKSVKLLGPGYRLHFEVRGTLGIVSGTEILARIPGGIPDCFAGIPRGEGDGAFSFRFPFLFEQNAVISTPKGYRTVVLPPKSQNGDAKSMVEESVVHWPKKGQLEASNRWTVRSPQIDDYLRPKIQEQFARVLRWPQAAVPLRK